MQLENIRLNEYKAQDRELVQLSTSTDVTQYPEKYLARYLDNAKSLEGRYVCADQFKETFDKYGFEYGGTKASRNRYNNPVHNSAAVMASALFNKNIENPPEEGKDTVIFLTGSPGAGKTTAVLETGKLSKDCAFVYEGQLANKEVAFKKIEAVLNAGYKPHIVVVHSKPEKALDGTFQRFEHEGRGASIEVIAKIQGGLHDSLKDIQIKWPDQVSLEIIDVRERDKGIIKHHDGWQELGILKSEGNYDDIKQKLEAHVEIRRANHDISADCYRQAKGLEPVAREQTLRQIPDDKHQNSQPER